MANVSGTGATPPPPVIQSKRETAPKTEQPKQQEAKPAERSKPASGHKVDILT